MAEELAGVIDYGDLAARANARVEAKNGQLPGGGRKQQVLQVFPKHPNGVRIGTLLQFQADFRRDRVVQQPLPGVFGRQIQLRGPVARLLVNPTLDQENRSLRLQFDDEIQDAFGLAAPDGQHPVGGNRLHRLPVLVVHLELLLFVLAIHGLFTNDDALFRHRPAQHLADIGVIADGFGDDVTGSFQSLINVRDALCGVHKRSGERSERQFGRFLTPHVVRQRLQTLFPGNHGLGAAFGLVGQVQIFEFALVESGLNASLQLVCELTLLLNRGQDRLFAGHQVAKVQQFLFNFANLDFVEIAGGFLTISGDERDGGTLIQQFDGRDQALQGDRDQLGDMQ